MLLTPRDLCHSLILCGSIVLNLAVILISIAVAG